jgi:hypothetical protein
MDSSFSSSSSSSSSSSLPPPPWIHDLANRGTYFSECCVQECTKDPLLDIRRLLKDRGSIWCSGPESLLVFTPSHEVQSPVIFPLADGQVLELTNPVSEQVIRDSRPPARVRGQPTLDGGMHPNIKQHRERDSLAEFTKAQTMGDAMRAAFQMLGHVDPNDKRVSKAICAFLETAQVIPSIGGLVVYHRNRWHFDGEASLLALLCLLHGIIRHVQSLE